MGLLDWFREPPADPDESYRRAVQGSGSQLGDDIWQGVKGAWDAVRPVRDVVFAPMAIGDMLMGQYAAWAGGDAGRQAYSTAWDRKRLEIEQAMGPEHFGGPLGWLREVEAAPGYGDVLAEAALPGDDPSYTDVQRFVKSGTAMLGNMFTNPVNLVGGGVGKGLQAWDRAIKAPTLTMRATALAESAANMYGSAIPAAAYAPEIAQQIVGGAQRGWEGLQADDTDAAVAGFGEAVLGTALAGLGIKGARHEARALGEYRRLRAMPDIEVASRQSELSERFMAGERGLAPELDIANRELQNRAADRTRDENLSLAELAKEQVLVQSTEQAAAAQLEAETLAADVARQARPEFRPEEAVDRRLADLRARAEGPRYKAEEVPPAVAPEPVVESTERLTPARQPVTMEAYGERRAEVEPAEPGRTEPGVVRELLVPEGAPRDVGEPEGARVAPVEPRPETPRPIAEVGADEPAPVPRDVTYHGGPEGLTELKPEATGRAHLYGAFSTSSRELAAEYAAGARGGQLYEVQAKAERPFSLEKRYRRAELERIDQETAKALPETATGHEFHFALRERLRAERPATDEVAREVVRRAAQLVEGAGYDAYHYQNRGPVGRGADVWVGFRAQPAKPAAATSEVARVIRPIPPGAVPTERAAPAAPAPPRAAVEARPPAPPRPVAPTPEAAPPAAKYATEPKPLEAAIASEDIQSESGYYYHATNRENAADIASTGSLKTFKPSHGTDQRVWPDGATEKRAYFSDKAGKVWQFAPEVGKSVVLRTKAGPQFRRESTSDIYSKTPVPARDLEILGQDGQWHPLSEFFRKAEPTKYATEPERTAGSAEWQRVTKPASGRQELENYLGSELASAAPLEVMDAAMLRPLQNDKIRAAVVEAIPVDVVDILSRHGFTAEDLARQPNVVGKSLPVESRLTVARGLSGALGSVGTRLRTALDRVLSSETAGRDRELLPTVSARDLNASEVVGLLAPSRIYGRSGELSDTRSRGAAAPAKASVPGLEYTREGREPTSAELARLLNRHEAIVSGRRVDDKGRYDPGQVIAPRSVMAEGFPLFAAKRHEPEALKTTDLGNQWQVETPDGKQVTVGKGVVATEQEARDYAVRYFGRERVPEMTLDQVKAQLPAAVAKRLRKQGDQFVARLPGGDIVIRPTGEIVMDPAALRAGYGEAAVKMAAAGELRARGAMQIVGPNAMVDIVEVGVLPHEVGGHVFLERFATPRERELLRREFETKAEASGRAWDEHMADDFQAWFGEQRAKPEARRTLVQKVFGRIFDFFRGVYRSLFPNRESIYRDIAEGRVFERRPQPQTLAESELARFATTPTEPTPPEAPTPPEYRPEGRPVEPGEEPRVEQRVAHIDAMARVLGIDPPALKRETVQHWSDLDDAIKEIVRTTPIEQLAAQAERRVLTNSEVQALDAMNRGVVDQTYEHLSEMSRALSRGDQGGAAAAEQRYMGEMMRAVATERAIVNDGTNAARALQARNRIMAAAPEGPGQMMRQIIRELPGLSVKQQAELLVAAQKEPLRAKDILRAAFSPGWKDKVLEWWKAGLLSAPKTDAAMLMGNTAEFFSRLGETAIGGLTERALTATGLIPKGRTRFAREEMGQELRGAMDELFPAMREWWENVRNVTGPEKPLVTARKLEHQVGAIGGTLGRIVRYPFRRAEAHDVLFRRIGGGGDLRKLSWRKAREELGAGAPTEQVERRATELFDEAKSGSGQKDLVSDVAKNQEQRTFQQANPLAVPILEFKRRYPLVGNLIAPFVLTPTNVAASVLKRSPLGFFTEGLRTLRKFRRGMATREEVIDAFASPMLGSTLLGGMLVLAKSGLLTGGGPPDRREKNLLKETGWQPYSFVFVNPKDGKKVYVPFNRFEPVSSTLGIAADLAEMEDPKRRGDLIAKGVESIAQNFTNKTYLQSMVDAMNVATNPSQFGRQWISSTLTSMVPNIFAATAQAIDPLVRDVTPAQAGLLGTPEKILKQGAARLPFVSQLLPPKPSATGEVIERPGWGPTRIFFPVQITQEKGGKELEKMLVRVGYVPGTPKRSLAHHGEEIPLNDADYRLLLEADRAAAARARALMQTAGFSSLPDTEEEAAAPGESKEGKIRSLYTKARQEARKIIFARPDVRRKLFEVRRGRRLASFAARQS